MRTDLSLCVVLGAIVSISSIAAFAAEPSQLFEETKGVRSLGIAMSDRYVAVGTGSRAGILIYDLTAHAAVAPVRSSAGAPWLDGETLVTVGRGNVVTTINLRTRQQGTIALPKKMELLSCKLAGDWLGIVSEGAKKGARALSVYNLKTKKLVGPLTEIAGEWAIVPGFLAWGTWTGINGQKDSVTLHDLTTGTSKSIATASGQVSSVALDRARVAWSDDGRTSFCYDIASGTTTELPGASTVALSNGWIVCEKDRKIVASKQPTDQPAMLADFKDRFIVSHLTTNGHIAALSCQGVFAIELPPEDSHPAATKPIDKKP